MYSVVVLLAMTAAGDAPAFGRGHSCGYSSCGCGPVTYGCSGAYSCAPYSCQPVSYGCDGPYYGGCCGPIVPGTASGTAGTGTGTGTGAGTPADWSPEDTEKVKAALKKLKISDADADKLIQAAKDIKEKPTGDKSFLELITDPKGIGALEGDSAKKQIQDYIDAIKKATGGMGRLSAPATIVVTLPAEARLTVDGYLTRSTSETRTLVTPDLRAGKTFRYTLKAEVTRAGKPMQVTENVEVRAGNATHVAFDFARFKAEEAPAKQSVAATPQRDEEPAAQRLMKDTRQQGEEFARARVKELGRQVRELLTQLTRQVFAPKQAKPDQKPAEAKVRQVETRASTSVNLKLDDPQTTQAARR